MSSGSSRNMVQISKMLSVLRPALAFCKSATAAARRLQRFLDLVQGASLPINRGWLRIAPASSPPVAVCPVVLPPEAVAGRS